VTQESKYPSPKPAKIEQQHVVDILRYCVRQYAVYHELTTSDYAQITKEKLVEWCLHEKLPISCVEEICASQYKGTGAQPAGSVITPSAVHTVWDLLQNPYVITELLTALWPWLTDVRPPLEIRPLQLMIGVNVIFRDRTALQISTTVPEFKDKPISSGFVAALVYEQLAGIITTLSQNGVDAMRAEHAEYFEPPPGTEGKFTQYVDD